MAGIYDINPFMHNVEKWPNIFQKSFNAHTVRLLKCVSPFFNIMLERVDPLSTKPTPQNGQTLPKDSPAVCRRIIWVCLAI